MSIDISSATASQTGALDAQANQVLKNARAATSVSAASKLDAKTEKAGKDFESVLLGSWLQQAESTFASVPGGDGEEDEDAGKDSFQGIAMQALAGSLTASGGIGIAKMITQHLRTAQAQLNAVAAEKSSVTTGSSASKQQ